jgi:HTH-type transcriptional regulator / antitoxin HigA
LLHGKKEIFLDEWDQGEQLESSQEQEADRWANEFLISPQYRAELTHIRSKEAVQDLADRIDIHAGIIVGRLQHDEVIPMNWMNDLKDRFNSKFLFPHTEQLPEDIF